MTGYNEAVLFLIYRVCFALRSCSALCTVYLKRQLNRAQMVTWSIYQIQCVNEARQGDGDGWKGGR